MRLKVIKSDGSNERYLHTKVLGTFNHALSMVGESDLILAEQFAEAVTFHLYHKSGSSLIMSKEIHSLISTVLKTTGFVEAAEVLDEWRVVRKLKRKRVEVVGEDGQTVSRWEKSQIVNDLVRREGLNRSIARVIAAAVEEKVLGMGVTRVTKMLIRQLVLADMSAMMQAQSQLLEAV